jgi:hypothetical protein
MLKCRKWIKVSFLVWLAAVVGLGIYCRSVEYREGQQAGCTMNIRNVQMGMRAYQNMNGISPGDPGFRKALIVGAGTNVGVDPVCPAGGTYTWLEGAFPAWGVLVLRCSHKSHVPTDYSDW